MQWRSLLEIKGVYSIPVSVDGLWKAWGLKGKYKTPMQFKQAAINRAVLEVNAACLGFGLTTESDRLGFRGAVKGYVFTVIRQRQYGPLPVDPTTPDEETAESLSAERRGRYE